MFKIISFSLIVFVFILLITLIQKYGEKDNYQYKKYSIGLVIVVLACSVFLVYKINSFPDVFVDEGNGMYDSWSLIHYGVDSNLNAHPVYLQSFAGQGQSIFYANIAGLFLKIFGYKLWAFRLPLVLLNIINLLLLSYIGLKNFNSKIAFWIVTVIGTSPYLLTMSRYGMDCNVSLFVFSIGVQLLYLGMIQDNYLKKQFQLSVGLLVIGLTAYAYNVAWIFLPGFLISLFIFIVCSHHVRIRDIIIPTFIMMIEIVPILTFAIRSNIPHLNETTKILFWTSPKLLASRAADSLISFKGNIFNNIYINLCEGFKILITGTDNLTWNSVLNFGPYYMFTLPFFIVGLVVLIKNSKNIVYSIIISMIIGCMPMIMTVKPNYNHWIFLHLPVLLVIAIGILSSIQNSKLETGLLVSYLVMSLSFSNYYFSQQRYTGWSISGLSEVKALHTKNYKKVYFVSNDPSFLYNIRTSLPISPYLYQKTKDHPYSKTILNMETKYDNFEKLQLTDDLKNRSLFLIQQNELTSYHDLIDRLDLKGSITINSVTYNVYKN